MVKLNNEIKFNNETIKNLIMDALDKKEKGIEIDVKELVINILKYADRDFGLDTVNRKYTEEELQNSNYMHINEKDDNRAYVGQTSKKPKERWIAGYYNQYLGNSIKSHSWNWEEDFSHVVLCYGLTKEEADTLEIKLISLFKSTDKRYGYNIANGGHCKGKHSEETKKKLSDAKKGEKHPFYGKHLSEETRKKIGDAQRGEKNHMYGKDVSEETRKKLSEVLKGKKHSEEHKKKISESNKGKKLSEETRKKLSDSAKGRITSEETKKKLSEAKKGEKNSFYGKHHTEESKKKMSEARKGTHHTEETRKKMSEAKKGENNYMYGKHLSEETRKKMSEAKKGENNPKAKKVYCNRMIFPTAKECAKFYNVNYGTMRNWLQGRCKMRSEFTKLGLRYATEEDIEKYPIYIEEEQNQQNQQDQ